MSEYKIPYQFDTPIPRYFKENGWLPIDKPEIFLRNYRFLEWSFSKCSRKPRRQFYDFKELELSPFEFICGRDKSSHECGLSVGVFRNQLNMYEKAGLLEKTTNSVTNRFTCYRWLTDRFNENNSQLDNQPATNRQPTGQPQTRTRDIEDIDTEEQQQDAAVSEDIEIQKEPHSGKITAIYDGWKYLEENIEPSESKQPIYYILSDVEKKNLIVSTIKKLKTLEVSGADIQWLKENTTINRVMLAIEYVQNVKIRTTVVQTIKWHVQKIIPPEIPKRKLSPKETVLLHFKNGETYNDAQFYIDDVGITFYRGNYPHTLKFNDHGFFEQYENILRKLQIQVSDKKQTA